MRGLMLAIECLKTNFYKKPILIIDKVKYKGNDRTWSYWEDGKGEWDELLTKKWSKIFFGSDTFSDTLNISPYSYKMIRSEFFYENLWKSIQLKSHIKFIEDDVHNFLKLKME